MSTISPDDYVNYRLKRAFETLNEVENLITLKYWNTAMNRLYYAAFYAVSALLAKHKINAHSHTGIRQKFGEHFIKAEIIDATHGRLFSELFDKRQKGDYNDFFDFDEESVTKLFPQTKDLIEVVTRLIEGPFMKD